MKWFWISILLLTSCCDRPCGEAVWSTYLEQEKEIHFEMDGLTYPQWPIEFSSYAHELSRKTYATSEYRMRRDARERRLLRARLRYITVQRDIDLDRCYCMYDKEAELSARKAMK